MSGTGAAEGADDAALRRLERKWQDEVGHALLDRPFETPGSRMVFERQFERVESALALLPPGPLVEIGCGRGQFLAHLSKAAPGRDRLLVGVDVSIAVRGVLALGIEAVRADGEALPFRDGSLAAVVYNGSLHHVVDYRRAVREAFRVLAPGGRLVVFEPSSSAFSRTAHRLLDPIVFRASLEYESPVDQLRKHAFREEAILDEIRAQGAAVTERKSDFLAYPVTGCYAGSPLTKSVGLMRGLLALEGVLERVPLVAGLSRLVSWRFLLSADKPGPATRSFAKTLKGILSCPACHGNLLDRGSRLACSACRLGYPLDGSIPILLADEASAA